LGLSFLLLGLLQAKTSFDEMPEEGTEQAEIRQRGQGQHCKDTYAGELLSIKYCPKISLPFFASFCNILIPSFCE